METSRGVKTIESVSNEGERPVFVVDEEIMKKCDLKALAETAF